ncbi:carboxypeptidase family protein [Geothermobacter ehrlichii]|uniref:Carboxypeptidase family protein n=1 Tax=Geothermobacter ehrlichii TaxID=213224 RepID=A0A5D3WPG4_9BACT|nr:hypothetical protein [Geothermobacter ehrlichii]TYO99298.1 carboxypeptidase family protein [Geothermobacter ehrlichii]
MRRIFWLLGLVLLAGCVAGTGTKVADDSAVGVSYVDMDGRTGLSGTVVLKKNGEPLAGAFVNVYADTMSNLLGPSQYISRPSDKDGRFMLDIPPGTYYVVARKRMSGEPSGPLAPGDYYSEHQRVKVEVRPGWMTVLNLEVVPMKAPMFFKKSPVERRTDTGIRGRLVDAAGKPIPGSFAIAYVDADMKRLPDFASTLSDADGRFTLYLPEGGSYYLAARVHAWDMPRPGELYGRYGGDKPRSVRVKKGEFVEGITLVLTPFTGEYKSGKSRRPY